MPGSSTRSTRPVAAAERALAEGELSADDAYELAVHTQLPYGEAMSALVAVLDPAEIAARLAGPPPPKPSWSPYGRDMGHFTAGVRLHLVPRLADADRERLAEAAAAALRSDLGRPDKLFAASAVLAAQLGCSEEVAEFVSRWPDGWFGQGGGGGGRTRRSRSGLAPGRRSGPRRGARRCGRRWRTRSRAGSRRASWTTWRASNARSRPARAGWRCCSRRSRRVCTRPRRRR